MDKEIIATYLDRIDKMMDEYYENTDDEEKIARLADEIAQLNLNSIPLPIAPSSCDSQPYVLLDSEGEFPIVYDIPQTTYEETVDIIYDIAILYNSLAAFFDSVGIDHVMLENMLLAYYGLPVVSRKSADMNNWRYMNRSYIGSIGEVAKSSGRKQ